QLSFYLCTAHAFYLTWRNSLDPYYLAPLLLLLAGAVAALIYVFRSTRELRVYLGFFAAGSAWVLYAVDEPRTEPAAFALVLGLMLVLTHVAGSALFRAVMGERESRRRNEVLIEASPDSLLRVRAGLVVDAAALRGEPGQRLRQHEIVGAPVGALLPERSSAVEQALETALRSGVAQRVEGELPSRADEPSLTVALRIVSMRSEEALIYVRDRTEERRMEEHVIRADRVASVGTLAFGVAHEINNPLSFVQNNAEWLIQSLEDPSDCAGRPTRRQMVEALEDVRDGGNRIRQIVDDLLLSASENANGGRADLEKALGAAVKLAGGQLRQRAELSVSASGVPSLAIPESRLVQVLLNLLVNAAQALPGRSTHENHIAVRAVHRPDDRVEIEVEDNGRGIPQEKLGHVLEPFFTTKPPGMGTGLGLYVTHQIVTGVGGELFIDSTEGRGTTVRLVLPAVSQGSAPAHRRDRVEAPAPDRPVRARVLVVDDEPAVARALKRALREHEVHVCHGGAEAVERIESEAFDVILCDLMMPDVTGAELYRRVDEQTRERLVLITGGAFDPDVRSFLEETPVRVLHKPIDLDAVRSAIDELMASQPRRPGSIAAAG
ncbi:MAG: hybrid sensor histidine kinase/response regulator, partial [Polyangiales bacterium]